MLRWQGQVAVSPPVYDGLSCGLVFKICWVSVVLEQWVRGWGTQIQ